MPVIAVFERLTTKIEEMIGTLEKLSVSVVNRDMELQHERFCTYRDPK